MVPKDYNNTFFQLQQSQSYKGAKKVLPIINKWINPKTVIDVGCGVGAWLKVFQELGAGKITGLDGDYVDTNNLLIDKNEFVVADLEKSVKAATTYDLVMCLEVAEHLTPNRAESFVDDLCAISDVILFSAAIPGQEGTFHLNEQYPGYWIDFFKKNNFECIDCIRPIIWNDTEIEFWYKQNMMLFIKKEAIIKYAFLNELPTYMGANLVHPNLLAYKTNKAIEMEKRLMNPAKAGYYFLRNAFKK